VAAGIYAAGVARVRRSRRQGRKLALPVWLLPAIVCALVEGYFLWWLGDAAYAAYAGPPGLLTVTHCTHHEWREERLDWTCEGTFVSHDGRLRIDGVDLSEENFAHNPLRSHSHLVFPTRVSGARSDTAHPDGKDWQEHVMMLTIVTALVSLHFYGAKRVLEESRAPATPSRPAGRTVRARRRRR
jgi:hypothetical protein